MAQQTAVEWLVEQYQKKVGKSITIVMQEQIKEANKMFEEQVKNAYNDAIEAEMKVDYVTKSPTAEQYYNETYGK